MDNDPYKNSARMFDRLFEGMNKGLRLVGIRMFRPSKGMSILDVGCGTGTYLELYQRYQCSLVGIDKSPSMLEMARRRLDDTARLDLADATAMPYEDARFDLVVVMLTLHEMPPRIRPLVMAEMKRVLKKDGHLLLIDYHPGPYQPMQGWVSKTIIFLAELAAGSEHYRNYRNFLKDGGLGRLIDQHALIVEKQQILAGGTLSVCLTR